MKAEAPLEKPSGEWLATFASYSTDLPAGAGTFPATLELAFPGRQQSRTVLQATVKVATADLGHAELGGARSYNLLLTGEVLRGGQLFDRFRYKFDFPAAAGRAPRYLPLVFQRPLRPGDYRLVLKVEDLDGKQFFRRDRTLDGAGGGGRRCRRRRPPTPRPRACSPRPTRCSPAATPR